MVGKFIALTDISILRAYRFENLNRHVLISRGRQFHVNNNLAPGMYLFIVTLSGSLDRCMYAYVSQCVLLIDIIPTLKRHLIASNL